MDGLKELIGKKVYVVLRSERKYTGTIQTINDKIITLIDKYNEVVMFNISEISSLEVEE